MTVLSSGRVDCSYEAMMLVEVYSAEAFNLDMLVAIRLGGCSSTCYFPCFFSGHPTLSAG